MAAFQPGTAVGDDQLNARQPARRRRTQELDPELLGLRQGFRPCGALPEVQASFEPRQKWVNLDSTTIGDGHLQRTSPSPV